MTVLVGRWVRVDASVALAETRLAEEAYVFSDALDGARPVMPNTITNRFRNLCRKMDDMDGGGEPWSYRFHDLRHYTATELMRSGHNARTVADRLGHSDPALTLRVYTHNTDDQAMAAAASLEAGLTASQSLPGTPLPEARPTLLVAELCPQPSYSPADCS